MTKRDYSAPFQDVRKKEETIQNSYLDLVCEIEPNIIENLPLESYLQLTRNHNDLNTHKVSELFVDRLQVLLSQDTVLLQDTELIQELINILPNADKQTILNNFNSFRKQFLDWIKEYYFEKDWIITSALKTLAHNREQSLKKENQLKVLLTTIRVSAHESFSSERGLGIQEEMDIYNENLTSFENRINQRKKELNKQYKERAKNHTFKTKDFDIEKLRWLALWNVGKYTAADIVTKELGLKPSDSWQKDGTVWKENKGGWDENEKFINKKNYVYKEIQKLKDFDLPVRKKNSRN
ncbi:MAG: hypothetical protein WKF90_14765 [Pyrinomonadaceae bacterium]